VVQEIRFGGTAALSAVQVASGSHIASLPRADKTFQTMYADALKARPAWLKDRDTIANSLRSTQEGRAIYGDPERGATLPQAWRMHRVLTGYLKVCLLARRLPSTATDGIPEMVPFSPADLVGTLARGFAKMEGFAPQLFVHDGRVGHCMHAQGHDPATGTFTYHDPWPGRSLLCFEFNIAGVAAEQVEDGRWRITDTELERVICAAFIMPTEWAELTGRAYRISYAALQQSDFRTAGFIVEDELYIEHDLQLAASDGGQPAENSVGRGRRSLPRQATARRRSRS
jgi:hypothetical protein